MDSKMNLIGDIGATNSRFYILNIESEQIFFKNYES